MRFLAVVLPALLLAAGCAGPKPAFEPARHPPLGLRLILASLVLQDMRENTVPLETPSFARFGGRAFNKALEAEDSAALRAEVERNLAGEGVPMHLEVTVAEAELGWLGRLLHATETGRFKVHVHFRHGTQRLAECGGSVVLERPNTHVTRESLQDLFRAGLALAVHQCLESTREELKKTPRLLPGAAPI